jgi:hypothetical protein
MEHVGSAHDEQELEALKTAAVQRLASLYPQLDLDLDRADRQRRRGWGERRSVGRETGSVADRVLAAGPLWDGLCSAWIHRRNVR